MTVTDTTEPLRLEAETALTVTLELKSEDLSLVGTTGSYDIIAYFTNYPTDQRISNTYGTRFDDPCATGVTLN